MDLSEDELRRRRPVWNALSELFLDTALDEGDRRRIAVQLHASGYSDSQLEAIYGDEVAPVCAPNLMTVAGEWAGFDPEWLERSILARRRSALSKAGSWVARLFAIPVAGAVRKDFAEVKRLLARLRIGQDGLLRALESRAPEAVDAAETLALQRELARAPETFEALKRALSRPEPEVRRAVLLALGAIDPAAAIDVLLTYLRAEAPEERRASLEALVEAARGLGSSTPQPEVAAALEPWLRAPDPRDRKRALMILELIATTPGTVPLLLGALDQPVEDNRLALAGAMRAAQPPIGEVEPSLLDALRPSQPTAIRQTAAQVLVFLTADHRDRWPGDVQRLVPLTSDRDQLVQARIATALGWIGDPRALDPVLALARSSSTEIRASALHALGRLGRTAPEKVLTVIREALVQEESASRSAALRAAAELGPGAAPLRAELERTLKDDNFFVRFEAKNALEAIDGKRPG